MCGWEVMDPVECKGLEAGEDLEPLKMREMLLEFTKQAVRARKSARSQCP